MMRLNRGGRCVEALRDVGQKQREVYRTWHEPGAGSALRYREHEG